MNNEYLPNFKAILDLCHCLDLIMKNQERHYKYTIGSNLLGYSKEMLFLINRTNRAKDLGRVSFLQQLADKCEDLKTMLILAKQITMNTKKVKYLDNNESQKGKMGLG